MSGGAVAADGFMDRERSGLAWREAGASRPDGPPVIFLHGLGGTRVAWGAQLRGLSGRLQCVAWDMPGYGDSVPLDPLTFVGIAGRVVDLIDELGVDQVDLVGLSFGGMHALHAALEFPERIRRLVLADTSPAFGMDGTKREDWVASRLAPLENGGVPDDGAETVLDMITAVPLDVRIRNENIEAFGHITAGGFRAAVNCLPDHDVRGDLHHIAHPSLVIVGELDEETPPSYARMLHQGLANSRLETIAGVGHLTPAEDPDRFNELVVDFLGPPTPPL